MKKIIVILMLIFLSGCVSLENLPDYIAGTYVRQPAEGTGGRYIKTFDSAYEVLFDKAAERVEEIGGRIRYKSKRKGVIIAWYFDEVYRRCIDTTKVTVYFKEITSGKTQIDVACGNYGLARFVSEKLFPKL